MPHSPTLSPSDMYRSQEAAAQSLSTGRRTDRPQPGEKPSQTCQEVAAILLDDSKADTAHELVSFFKQVFGFDLLLASYDPLTKRFSLLADSRGIETPSRLSQGDPLEQALSEARLLQRKTTTSWDSGTITPATQQLASRFGSTHVSIYSLIDSEGDLQGAVIAVRNEATIPGQLLHQASAPVAKYLRLNRTADYSIRQRTQLAISNIIASKRLHLALLCLGVFTALLFVPVPFRVKAECQCEPTHKRIVAAPFEGQLLTSFVKPGDYVKAGQLVAEMDGKELRSRIASTEATLQQARQRYSAAVAAGDASSASKEHLEVEHLRQQLAIYSEREHRLQLTSPIEGVVVSGDLEQEHGSSLVIGQGLFEISPLDSLTAEIAIDETDIQHLALEQEVALSFEGDFGRRYSAHIERIHPRSQIIDQNNVFVVEAKISDLDTDLSPGMKGYAKVHCGRRALGWVLFNKPYTSWCRFWGWY